VFPNKLKFAKVIPIYKKGDMYDPKNYRPISILSTFSKIFGSSMLSRLNNFLYSCNIISNRQHGFQKNKSTDTALFDFLTNTMARLNKGYYVIGLFADLSKAFDTVDHQILLSQLYRYGIRGISYDWVKSYLTDRMQAVQIKKRIQNNLGTSFSTVKKVSKGVPQGSILGPILFSLYINDLLQCIEPGFGVLYADDVNILVSGNSMKELNENLKFTFDNLVTWFSANKLNLNYEKTTILNFHLKRQSLLSSLAILDSGTIKISSSVKFLGVLIQDNFQ